MTLRREGPYIVLRRHSRRFFPFKGKKIYENCGFLFWKSQKRYSDGSIQKKIGVKKIVLEFFNTNPAFGSAAEHRRF